MLYKGANTQIKDISTDGSTKGTVMFYASIFGNIDKAGDIVMPGAFAKTIVENFKNIKHYKNHDGRFMPGVITSLVEDQTGLLTTSSLILSTEAGNETYEQYKAMAAAGKSMPHSIGYWTIKSDYDATKQANILRELKLDEVSTLTLNPANDEAIMVAIKSLGIDELIIEEKYLSIMLNARLKDAKLEQIEATKKMINALLDKLAAKALDCSKQPQKGLFSRAAITINN